MPAYPDFGTVVLEKQRPFQAQRQEQRDGEPTIGDIVLVGEALLQVGNGALLNGDDL